MHLQHNSSTLKHCSLQVLHVFNLTVHEHTEQTWRFSLLPLHMFQVPSVFYQFPLVCDSPLYVPPSSAPVMSACPRGLLMLGLVSTIVSWVLCFPPFLFHLLLGGNTSSGNFLRKVAWTVKTLKPCMPENVISSFSHLIQVPWVCHSGWELFPLAFVRCLAFTPFNF